MSKSVRNTVIAAAVVAVVAVAAAPFILKGIKKDNNIPVDASVSDTAAVQQDFFVSEPAQIEEETTADVIGEILETMTQQQQQAAAQQQNDSAAQYNYTTAAQYQQTQSSGNSGSATTRTQTPATTRAQAPATTKAQAPATTKKQTTTTTKKAETTTQKADTSGGNMQAVDGVDAMSSGGVVSYLWNPEGQFYYVEDNPWQRNFGFNVVYDWAAATMVMYYDTWRACFDYDDLEWMIQAWKGQYGFLFIGGEIGVYTREPGSVQVTASHYNCADDNHLINMEMTIYYDAHDGNGYTKLFTRTYYPHWWSTGFVDGHLADYKFNDRSCLIQTARLTMYDEDMLEAFTTALKGVGFTQVDSRSQVSTANPDTFAVVGLDVYYAWKNIDQGYRTR